MKYELIEDYKNGYEEELVQEKVTEYFNPYDYIIGDWAYGKLRLKGFCESKNPLYKPLNAIEQKDFYIKNECAYACRYFILKKVTK